MDIPDVKEFAEKHAGERFSILAEAAPRQSTNHPSVLMFLIGYRIDPVQKLIFTCYSPAEWKTPCTPHDVYVVESGTGWYVYTSNVIGPAPEDHRPGDIFPEAKPLSSTWRFTYRDKAADPVLPELTPEQKARYYGFRSVEEMKRSLEIYD